MFEWSIEHQVLWKLVYHRGERCSKPQAGGPRRGHTEQPPGHLCYPSHVTPQHCTISCWFLKIKMTKLFFLNANLVSAYRCSFHLLSHEAESLLSFLPISFPSFPGRVSAVSVDSPTAHDQPVSSDVSRLATTLPGKGDQLPASESRRIPPHDPGQIQNSPQHPRHE